MYSASWMEADHEHYAETASRFFDKELRPNIERWRRDGQIDRDFWRRAGDVGILGATLAEDHGGAACPRSFDAVTMYEHSRTGDTSWGFGVHNYVAHYIERYATPEQKTRWLPGLISGDLVAAIAMTEPSTGSNLQGIKTHAVLEGDCYRINGSKTFITNGQLANLICVVTKTERDAGAKGISLIMVETDGAEGFRRGRNLEKIGLKGQDTSELFFDDLRVPVDNVLGGETGRGFYQLMEQLAWERLSIGVVSLGACDYAIEETLNYTREREAFSKPLFDMQNTRFTLAEVKTKVEVTRAFLDQCIVKLDAGTLDAATAAMAKWWASDVQCEIIDECLQLFGGYGYMLEYPIAHLYTDARVQRIYGGANEIMKEIIARSL